MTSLPILQPGVRVTDANGNPVSGAKLKFFAAGTTTPLSVYSDADGLTTLGTTVYTDDGGYPVVSSGSSTKTLVYSTAEELKVVITDATDTTIATHDNVTGSIPTPSATTTALPTVPVVSKSSDYTVVTGDRGKLINVNPTGGTVEIALPSAVTVGDNWTIGVRHSGPTTTNKVVIRASGTQTIAGPGQSTQAAIVLHGLGNTVWLVSDGAGWNISAEVPAYMTGQAAYTSVVARRTATPVNPDIGSRYIITGTPTGAWLTASYAEHDLVEYVGNATWIKYPLRDGLLARVVEEQTTYCYNDTAGEWEAWANVLDPGTGSRKTSRFSNLVADGSGGGTATSGSWGTIPITSEYTRSTGYVSTGATLSTNQITIPQGAYRVLITNPFFGTYISRMRFRPVTQTSSWDNTRYSDVVVAGTTDTGPDTVLTTATAVINDEVIIDATSEEFILEYYVSNTQASVGLGTPSSGTGQQETYARIFLESLDNIQGPIGPAGAQGDDGLDAAYSFAWSTSTTGDPGTGKIAGNNATIASITQIAVNETDASGASIAGMIATWDDSTTSNNRAIVKISKEGAPGNYAGFKISGAGTDVGTYWTFPVTYLSTAGTLANNDTVAVAVSLTGDEGAAGITVPDVTGLTNLSPPDYTGTPDKILVHDVSVGGLKQMPITDLGVTMSGGNAVFYGTSTAALGVAGVGYAGIGIAGYGGTTFVVAPDGTNGRVAISDTSMQMHYDNIALGKQKSSTVTITIASPGVVTWASHGLTAGMEVAFSTTLGGALPTGITAGTRYYVIAAGLATDTFRVSATYGGSAVNTSGTQSGTHTCKAITNTPGITFKIPDFNASHSGADHPLMNLGVSEGASDYPYTFQFQGGYAGGSTQAGVGWMVMTIDSTGVAKPRLHVTGKDDNTAWAVGLFGAASEAQGTFFHLHTSNAVTAAHVHFTTASTGSAGTDGASVGMWTSDQLRVWNYENTHIAFGVNNVEQARLTTTGLGLGVTPASKLHTQSSGTGGLNTFRSAYANTSSGETHTSQFSCQDTGAGVVRTLFYAAGLINGAAYDQGTFAVFNEDGSLRMFEVDSLAAQSAARFRLYDRSNVATINLHGAGSSTFAGGALLNTHATAGLGYGTGAGGTVTQATSKSTGVTLNQACGTITMNNAALAAATSVSFTLTNSAISATDVPVVAIKSGATANSYQVTVSAVAAGSCSIHVRNVSAGSLGEAVVLSFAVIKAVAT